MLRLSGFELYSRWVPLMLLVDVTILDIRVYCTRNLFSNVFVT